MNVPSAVESSRACGSGALGSTGRPELAKLAAELLASGGPVVGNVLAQVVHVALEIHFVLLEPADVELLARGSTLELSGNILFVVTNNSASG